MQCSVVVPCAVCSVVQYVLRAVLRTACSAVCLIGVGMVLLHCVHCVACTCTMRVVPDSCAGFVCRDLHGTSQGSSRSFQMQSPGPTPSHHPAPTNTHPVGYSPSYLLDHAGCCSPPCSVFPSSHPIYSCTQTTISHSLSFSSFSLSSVQLSATVIT